MRVGSTASPTLRSRDISLSAKVRRGTVTITGKVTVLDQDNEPVRSAIVSAYWTLKGDENTHREGE